MTMKSNYLGFMAAAAMMSMGEHGSNTPSRIEERPTFVPKKIVSAGCKVYCFKIDKSLFSTLSEYPDNDYIIKNEACPIISLSRDRALKKFEKFMKKIEDDI